MKLLDLFQACDASGAGKPDSGTGLSYQFIRDDHGIATQVLEGHISGAYKFERQKLTSRSA